MKIESVVMILDHFLWTYQYDAVDAETMQPVLYPDPLIWGGGSYNLGGVKADMGKSPPQVNFFNPPPTDIY